MRSADDLPLCGKHGISNQISKFHSTAHRLARVRNLYVRTRHGLEEFSVYDGGWYEWSSDPKNPVAPVNAARTVANNIAITDAGATQRQIPTPHPRKGRHPAQRTEIHANHANHAGNKHPSTNSKSFLCLRLTRPDNKTIYAHNRIINLMFRRQRSKSEKTAACAINANSSQPPARAFCCGAAR